MENIQETISGHSDVVDYLCKNSFSGFSYDDKVFVKNLKIPRPSMQNLVQRKSGHSRSFNISWYEKCQWLTGSQNLNKMFCWYCLLFDHNKKTPWSSTGYENMKEFSRAVQKHQNSKEHTHSALKFKMFGQQNIVNVVDSARRQIIEKYNQTVRENRLMLRHFINMVLYLATQELAFRGHNENEDSLNQGNYRELAKFAATLDENFNKFLDNSSLFSGLSKTIQNDLIASISKIIENTITEEIKKTHFFAWEIDETTDISCFSQMSVIFRFIHEGKVVERFMGYFDVSKSRKADDLFKLLTTTFNHFDIQKKLIGQTYDGAAVMSGELNGLQAKIKSVAPQALFTHCYAHKMNLVLQDSSKKIRECRIFFCNVGAFSSFFSHSTKRTHILDLICGKRIPSNSETRWNFKSRIIRSLFEQRDNLIQVFDNILENYTEWDDITLREAQALKNYLNDFNFMFLVNIFNLIFTQTDLIFSVVQNKLLDINYCNERIKALLKTLNRFRTDDSVFEKLVSDMNNLESSSCAPKKRKTQSLADKELSDKRLFYEILDLIITQIGIRFGNVEKLKQLMDHSKFSVFSRNFPLDLLLSLKQIYPNIFNEEKLRRELEVLYSDQNIFGTSTKLSDMLSFIFDNKLCDDVPEIYKLLSLIISLPATSASVERSFSTLKRIRTCSRNTMGQNRLNNLSLIAIERGLVKTLAKNNSFYDAVIDNFALTKTRRIELLYKNI